MNWDGVLVGLGSFVIIGILHPVVIKAEYHCGTAVWPLFLVSGLACIAASLLTDSGVVSALVAVFGFTLLWSIGEIWKQEERVKKGWFPANPDKAEGKGATKAIQYAYMGAGLFFFLLGAVGAVLPVLPTVPFLLVAAFCFARGSKRFNDWFRSTGLYKKYLADYVDNRAMTLRSKLTILAYSTTMMALAFFLVPNIYARVFIILVVVVKYWYFFFRIRTEPENKPPETTPADTAADTAE